MIFPCCKTELSASLEGVSFVTCKCGQSFTPNVIIEYNEMMTIITDWRDVVNGKAHIVAEPGEGKFVADLVLRGLKFAGLNEEWGRVCSAAKEIRKLKKSLMDGHKKTLKDMSF